MIRDYTEYVGSLEAADEKHTEDEWKVIIEDEASDVDDFETIKDIDFIIQCLRDDGYVKEEERSVGIYRCNDCNQTFDEPQAVEESRGEFWGMSAYETMYYCPYCGSEDFDEVGIEG